MLYAFFWVIPRRPNFICRRFGTLCSISVFFALIHVCISYTVRVIGGILYWRIMCMCWFFKFLLFSFFASIADKWYRLGKKISCVILCFFASFCCCVSSCRSLIGDRSRGQVKRLSPMNVEVMGNTAAGAGRLVGTGRTVCFLQFATAATASFASCFTSRSSWRPSASLLFHFVTLMRYLVLLHIPYAVLCYLLCARLRVTESSVRSWPVLATAGIAQPV